MRKSKESLQNFLSFHNPTRTTYIDIDAEIPVADYVEKHKILEEVKRLESLKASLGPATPLKDAPDLAKFVQDHVGELEKLLGAE